MKKEKDTKGETVITSKKQKLKERKQFQRKRCLKIKKLRTKMKVEQKKWRWCRNRVIFMSKFKV